MPGQSARAASVAGVTAPSAPDLTNLPRFLDHLAERDAEAAACARLLLDEDWNVRGFWGPQQMDVWQLDLQRGDWLVQFRIERGFAEGVMIARSADSLPRLDAYRSLGFAIFAWARTHGVPFRLEEPRDVEHDFVTHGVAALTWLGEGHDEVFERVAAIAHDFSISSLRLEGAALVAARAAGVAAMEAAAAG